MTIREIAEDFGTPRAGAVSTVMALVRRSLARQVGVALSGGLTYRATPNREDVAP